MVRFSPLLLLLLPASPVFSQVTPASLKRPPAQALFERDWVLMNWALKHYDLNHDILLEPAEAQDAAEAFRRLADVNHDGRITPEEYAAARSAILQQD